MKRIYKYEIRPYTVDEEVGAEMPRDAEVLHVGTQMGPTATGGGEGVFAWAMVDLNAPMVRRRLVPVGTGHDMPALATVERYVGSVQFRTENLVFHIFDFGEVGLL